MPKIVIDSSRLTPRVEEYNARFGRNGYFNVFLRHNRRPPKHLRVENQDGQVIGKATLHIDHEKNDPRAKGIVTYIIEFFSKR